MMHYIQINRMSNEFRIFLLQYPVTFLSMNVSLSVPFLAERVTGHTDTKSVNTTIT